MNNIGQQRAGRRPLDRSSTRAAGSARPPNVRTLEGTSIPRHLVQRSRSRQRSRQGDRPRRPSRLRKDVTAKCYGGDILPPAQKKKKKKKSPPWAREAEGGGRRECASTGSVKASRQEAFIAGASGWGTITLRRRLPWIGILNKWRGMSSFKRSHMWPAARIRRRRGGRSSRGVDPARCLNHMFILRVALAVADLVIVEVA